MWQHRHLHNPHSHTKNIWFLPHLIQHVCDNKSAINATWKDENISVSDKKKTDADVAKVARLAISNIQQHSQVHAFWVEGHAEKCAPPFS
jgi:hypothetical protein